MTVPLIPCILAVTKKYVVKRTFSFLSHIEVWCFKLQIRHNALLRQSETLCFVPVQLKQSFLFESISLQSSTLFTVNTPTEGGRGGWRGVVLALLYEKYLSFYIFDHYLKCVWIFCQSTFLMSPLVLQSLIPAG